MYKSNALVITASCFNGIRLGNMNLDCVRDRNLEKPKLVIESLHTWQK